MLYEVITLTFFPLVGALVVWLLREGNVRLIRGVATFFAVAELAISLPLWWRMADAQPGFRFIEKVDWIPALGASYHLGLGAGLEDRGLAPEPDTDPGPGPARAARALLRAVHRDRGERQEAAA